jgi:regulator of sirC expression with transglutaminase-like and TPR domain
MLPTIDDSPQFHALLAGDPAADLTAVALEIARDAYPDLQPTAYLDGVARLARLVRARLSAFPEPWLTLTAINGVLFHDEGYRGNVADYYDPRNSYLNEVIDRRVGIPISLSVLYIAVAERLALPMAGVNLPSHFVVRTMSESEPVYIDPYHQGTFLDRAGCERLVSSVVHKPIHLSDEQLHPCGARPIVARMLQNLKTVYLSQQRIAAAVPVLKRLALLRPDHPEDLRDLGVACFYGDRRDESLGYLEEYLKLAPLADDAREIRRLLNSARIH